MRQADGSGDELIENSRLKLQTKKIRIVGKQRRIQVALDGGEIESIILEAGVVTEDEHRKQRDEKKDGEFANGRIFPSKTPAAIRLPGLLATLVS